VWLQWNIVRNVGDGRNTSFWHHNWVGGKALCVKFKHLYKVSINKFATLSDMGFWDHSGWLWRLGWKRRLWGWEKRFVNNSLFDLDSVHIQQCVTDA
jgi:hypothetical protein